MTDYPKSVFIFLITIPISPIASQQSVIPISGNDKGQVSGFLLNKLEKDNPGKSFNLACIFEQPMDSFLKGIDAPPQTSITFAPEPEIKNKDEPKVEKPNFEALAQLCWDNRKKIKKFKIVKV